MKRSTLQSLQMFVERCIEASIKLFHLLSPLTSVTQMKNVKYMKIVNTFIICWNNFKRTHAYLGMGGRDMGIEGNKQIQGRSLSPTSDEWKYALTWGVCLTQLFTSEIRNKQKICFWNHYVMMNNIVLCSMTIGLYKILE